MQGVPERFTGAELVAHIKKQVQADNNLGSKGITTAIAMTFQPYQINTIASPTFAFMYHICAKFRTTPKLQMYLTGSFLITKCIAPPKEKAPRKKRVSKIRFTEAHN